ncbi:DUF3093 domain-containing protein [Microcella frigidaquae]|uniref:DUF3093 domain-containing protein n=1 Tax=Microcella frigidaquae TaxID=424758 RepID=A0A840X2Y3_9MICO|nr:DUF3093 domain-containing protein [Microcella frigidaquae]MBB5616621.1 hypothetical protein [Microcella frigidaquae]NHN43937.1 DUF3093 family protein [Microcella frigidaquae]
MESYRERLWPAPWIALVAALAIPASLLTFAPVSILAGAVVGVILAGGVIAAAVVSAPLIVVGEGMLRAGTARIPLAVIAGTSVARREEARAARGPQLDARAHLVLRPDIDPVLRIDLADPDDPTPYWVVSTRRPEELAAAIEAGRTS